MANNQDKMNREQKEVYLQREPDTLFSIDERDLSPFGKIFQKQV